MMCGRGLAVLKRWKERRGRLYMKSFSLYFILRSFNASDQDVDYIKVSQRVRQLITVMKRHKRGILNTTTHVAITETYCN